MPQNEYKPVSWNGEPISNAKLNQMCANTQFIFERQPRMRWAAGGATRDTALKVISGKTPYPLVTTGNYFYLPVYFGDFFTGGCKPVVNATVEAGNLRARVTMKSHSALGVEIDHTGFVAIVSHDENPTNLASGWIHWTATGW